VPPKKKTELLRKSKCLLLTVLEAETSRIEALMDSVSFESRFFMGHHLMGGVSDLSGAFFFFLTRARIPVLRAPPS
jgi:hypothetical protein